jgi:hypothetical protein
MGSPGIRRIVGPGTRRIVVLPFDYDAKRIVCQAAIDRTDSVRSGRQAFLSFSRP